MKNPHNINHIWTIICQRSIVDTQTNMLSILDVIENINVDISKDVNFSDDKVIKIPFNLDIVTMWEKPSIDKNSTDIDCTILLLSPSDKEIAKTKIKIQLPPDKKRIRSIVKMHELPIVGAGEYKFILKSDSNKTYSEIPYNIIIK